MSQKRFSGLALLAIEKKESENLNYEKVIEDFVAKKSRKINCDFILGSLKKSYKKKTILHECDYLCCIWTCEKTNISMTSVCSQRREDRLKK